MEYSTWVAKVKSAINNTCKLALEYWDTNQKWLCLESKQIYVAVIGSKSHGYMQSFNTVIQKFQTHMKKHNISYPGDVNFLVIPSVIWRQSCILEVVYRWNGEMVKLQNGVMAKLWNGKMMIYINNVRVKRWNNLVEYICYVFVWHIELMV